MCNKVHLPRVKSLHSKVAQQNSTLLASLLVPDVFVPDVHYGHEEDGPYRKYCLVGFTMEVATSMVSHKKDNVGRKLYSLFLPTACTVTHSTFPFCVKLATRLYVQ